MTKELGKHRPYVGRLCALVSGLVTVCLGARVVLMLQGEMATTEGEARGGVEAREMAKGADDGGHGDRGSEATVEGKGWGMKSWAPSLTLCEGGSVFDSWLVASAAQVVLHESALILHFTQISASFSNFC